MNTILDSVKTETDATSPASTTVNMPLTNSQREITAMTAISESLAGLDDSGTRRVMTWVADHFGYRMTSPRKVNSKKK